MVIAIINSFHDGTKDKRQITQTDENHCQSLKCYLARVGCKDKKGVEKIVKWGCL